MKTIDTIRATIPHRFPFLMVDRVVEVSDDGKRAVAVKLVSANEPYFQGHFPDFPIMPGVLIIEALAQAAAAGLMAKAIADGRLGVLAGADGFRFHRMVRPGDTLRLEVELTRLRGPIGKVSGKATVDGQLVTEGEITFALVSRSELGIEAAT